MQYISRKAEYNFDSFDQFNDQISEQDITGTKHEITKENSRDGSFIHKGWITGAHPENHRGYPSINLTKLSGERWESISCELWVALDIALKAGEWFSFATFGIAPDTMWSRVITVNINSENELHFGHVPFHGEQVPTFVNKNVRFPMGRWVKLNMTLQCMGDVGYCAVWQDDLLIQEAKFEGGCGWIEKVHFGMYASGSVESGTVYNDSLKIYELIDS